MPSLNELKATLKDMLAEDGLGPALQRLKAALPPDSRAYNDVVLLETDLKEANRKMLRGSIGQAELDVKYNSLRERFMELLDSLDERDLEAAQSGKKSKQGSLLYQIPGQMAVEKETRCRVRIAYDEDTLLENIELTRDTRIKDVRIAEVMEVELIDPAETPAFSIRTFNSQDQFVEKDEYTEWIFFVKPLREGQFPLLLRVSVIEKVGDKERVRDIVLEETVVIVADPVEEAAATEFKPSGYVVGEAAAAKKKKPASRKPLQTTALALAALIAFSGITYAAVPPVRLEVDWVFTTLRDTRDAYQDFAEKYEGKPKAKKALEKVEEIDWTEAVQDSSVTQIEQFLEQHPDSRFAQEAAALLESLRPREEVTTPEAEEKTLVPAPSEKPVTEKQPVETSKVAPAPEPRGEMPPAPVKVEESVAEETVLPPVVEESPLNLQSAKLEALFAPDKMVFVQGGTFWMGCTDEQGSDCESDEMPKHQVTLKGFWIGKYEVTQAEWRAVMGENPSDNEGCDQCPVEQVSWNDVQQFIKELNRQTGKNYRLPTEAEWEYAARGGSKSKGNKYAGCNNLDEAGWYDYNSGRKTHPVGQKKPNELGLYDMSGNVWEWCADWYGDYPSDARTNPEGPVRGLNRVGRGSGWGDNQQGCRVAYRDGWNPGGRNGYLGFRLARSLQ
jgi:formylglycine-generating enzyme required for sulfatase activity